jgi:cell division protein FtsA
LPIGSNHITKDISQILEIDLESSEKKKCNFDQNLKISNHKDISIYTLKKIIFARIEEILELCSKSIKSNLFMMSQFNMVLMGEGSKILDNRYKDEISFPNNIDFLEETLENICQSGLKLGMGLNKQEVVVVPKNQIKLGFFEKLFHFFK